MRVATRQKATALALILAPVLSATMLACVGCGRRSETKWERDLTTGDYIPLPEEYRRPPEPKVPKRPVPDELVIPPPPQTLEPLPTDDETKPVEDADPEEID